MIICSTSGGKQVGCTFLDWSIYFLSGQTEHFNVESEKWAPLTNNPLQDITAHGHPKIRSYGVNRTQKIISKIQDLPGLSSFYMITPPIAEAAKELSIDRQTITVDQWNSIADYTVEFYNKSLDLASKQGVKIIFVSLDDNLKIFANTLRYLGKMPFENRYADTKEEITDSFDRLFFKDSVDTWKNLGLDTIWDKRERMALKQNFFDYNPINAELDFDHYWIDAQNLWHNGERELPKIMSWLGLQLNPDKFEEWKPIYRKWQEIILDTLQFQYNYKHIVDSIVNNWSYPIDLTFEQEAFIQHCLIYQHNLNLKTWQLEKFPNNTQELHKLLEPNIHPL
jgi:hypothetical protein